MVAPPEESQRLDRWLFFTRIFKSRALAGRVVSAQGVRVTRGGQTDLTEKPSFGLRIGDVIAFNRGDRLTVLEVIALGTRRGPAAEAQTLYKDHSPPSPPKPERPIPVAERETGAGRPTKKDRRELDRFRSKADDGGPQ